MNSILKIASIVVAMSMILGCGGSDYQQLVKSELASGVRYDSLMFGLSFGDTQKEFFSRCWELNKEGVISHGAKNMNIKYTIKNDSGSDIGMLFYPVFDADDRIRKMDVEFSYQGWAPWNEAYQADKLMPVVKDSLEAWYPGNAFMELEVQNETFWVKVDGNRRITMKSNGKEAVLVKMINMLNEEN